MNRREVVFISEKLEIWGRTRLDFGVSAHSGGSGGFGSLIRSFKYWFDRSAIAVVSFFVVG